MKKIISLCLTVACLLSLCACQSAGETAESSQPEASRSGEAPERITEGTETSKNQEDPASRMEASSQEQSSDLMESESNRQTPDERSVLPERYPDSFQDTPTEFGEYWVCAKSMVCDPKKTMPEVRVVWHGSTLRENIDYTLRQEDRNPSSVGRHSVTVTMKGNYEGSGKAEYLIFPRAVSLEDASRQDRSITVRWKVSDSRINEYLVEYASDPQFSDAKTQRTENGQTELEVKDPDQSRRCYFRVRACCRSDSEVLYSDWSKPKAVPAGEGQGIQGNLEVIDGAAYVDGILIVNKTYGLPASYGNGFDKETSLAFYRLVDAAAKDGISIWDISDYRSYETQRYTYQSYVWDRGVEEADRCSARPGHSEHQTGLAIDVNTTSDYFAGTAEAIWLEEHCMEYGFIIRYPKGKEAVTGYKYEPWHIRYLGVEKAKMIADSGLTLEEYYGLTSEYQD